MCISALGRKFGGNSVLFIGNIDLAKAMVMDGRSLLVMKLDDAMLSVHEPVPVPSMAYAFSFGPDSTQKYEYIGLPVVGDWVPFLRPWQLWTVDRVLFHKWFDTVDDEDIDHLPDPLKAAFKGIIDEIKEQLWRRHHKHDEWWGDITVDDTTVGDFRTSAAGLASADVLSTHGPVIPTKGVGDLLNGRSRKAISLDELAQAIVNDGRKPVPAISRWKDKRRPNRDFVFLLGTDDSKAFQYLCRPTAINDTTRWSLSKTRNNRMFSGRFIVVDHTTVRVPEIWREATQALMRAVEKLNRQRDGR